MSRKGFTLVELLATIVIIAVIMGLVLPSATRVSKENKNKMCEAYQQMMVEYAMTSKYSNKFYIDLSELEELDKVKKDCDGYVTIDYNGEVPVYKAHLSCNDGCHTDDFVEPDARSNTRTIFAPNPKCKDNVIYNGTSQYLVSPGEGYALSNAKRINVGKQNVVANLVDKNVYAWEDHTQNELVIRDCEIKKREITVVAENHEFIYLNSVPTFTYKLENTITLNGKVENPLSSGVTYTVKDSNGNVVNVTSTTPVGTYTIVPNASAKSNYKLKYQNGTLTIKPKPVVVTAKSDSKTYDGNSLKNSACSFVTVPTGHTVTCTMTSASTITNVGSVDNVIQNTIIKNSSGANVTSNFQITKNKGTLTVNLKQLIPNTPSCSNKTYNGNTAASCTITYSNVVSGDSITGGATCTFADKNVGTNKTVTCSSFTKSGTGNTNYTVPSGSKTTTANITAKTLTANTPSCSNKTYNGNTAASCTISYSNVVSGDSVTGSATCTFADANVGNGKTVTCSSFTKSGTGNANYAVPSGSKTTTANITAQACNAPTGVSISTAGKVTWTASSNCSSGQHQVSIDNSNWTNASSGADYKSTIIASTGTRTVYVRAVAPSSNYSTSSSGSASTTVYSVSLTKGTGVSSVTGAGNYIKGSTATINATMASHYIWSKWTGTPATSTQNYSATVNENWSATANATNLCASTTDKPACGNYGGCSVTYKQQSGTKTRSCTHKYYSNVSGYTSHLCSTGTTYNDSASCNGATDACASGSTYDSPSCGNYGSCSVSCSDQTGTMTRSCTHKYYSNKISGYLCSTGSAYNDSTSCTGSQSCGSWHLRRNYADVGTCGYTCPRFCSEQHSTSTWSCTAQTSDPTSASQRTGRNCWCKY